MTLLDLRWIPKAGGDAGLGFGFADGEGHMDLFNCSNAVVIDGRNSIVVADQTNLRVWMVVDNDATTGDYTKIRNRASGDTRLRRLQEAL